VITEETFNTENAKDLTDHFILADPLDGTREFVAGRDEFTVNIALIENGQAPDHSRYRFAQIDICDARPAQAVRSISADGHPARRIHTDERGRHVHAAARGAPLLALP
jgi:3'-phosphoadenosine 5'-phosphosulfate (PAPS) 3'-phosphatase